MEFDSRYVARKVENYKLFKCFSTPIRMRLYGNNLKVNSYRLNSKNTKKINKQTNLKFGCAVNDLIKWH